VSAHGLASRIRSECRILNGEMQRVATALARHADTGHDDDLDAAALRLQLWYTGLETLLVAILQATDGDIPAGTAWHRELCDQALRATATRGPLLPETTRPALDQARAFRHRVRNAYGVVFNPDLLRAVATQVHTAHPTLMASLLAYADACDAIQP
jgi:hypothetical protein